MLSSAESEWRRERTPGLCYSSLLSLGRRIMTRLRISIVEYLNTAPLVWGFTHGPLAGRYDLGFTVPSLCAEALRSGEADVAIIPAIEYQRMEGVVALPGMGVAAKGAVRSILVIAKRPIEQARRLALDASSRTSAALVRLLCAGRWRIQPEFIEAAPDPAAMLAVADAALVIGDPALQVAVKAEALSEKLPGGGVCCKGDPSELPVPGFDTLFLYDVAYEWREMTGRPCVLAFWAARHATATPEVVADFGASKSYGVARIAEIADVASAKLALPVDALKRYLRENVDYSLDEENRVGLELFYKMCAEAGLIAKARPLEFAAAESRAGAGT